MLSELTELSELVLSELTELSELVLSELTELSAWARLYDMQYRSDIHGIC